MTIADVVIETRELGPIVHVRGEIDLSNAETIRSEIIDAVPREARGLVLDLTETTYLDSTGVRLLFELADRLQSRRQRLVLVVREAALVRRVLVLTKLDDAVPMHDELDAAIAALGN
jgi:anti-sigma B factor antagonist/stage II sporulation protein AA (anti-sigma F factor antagonist)